MHSLKIKDYSFGHSKLGYCSDYQSSDYFMWDRSPILDDDIVVYTDGAIHEATDPNHSVAWIIEPLEISPSVYTDVQKLSNNFSKIYTHEKTLLDIGDKYELVTFGCCWICQTDHDIYKKTKNVSIISSHKNDTNGHKLRHEVIQKFELSIDIYGRGYNYIEYKLDGLKDYRFSIVIENCKRDYWFTEKLIDCLVTGTVPIYWGCPSIGDFFDIRGFIVFDTIDELEKILSNLTEDDYNSKLEYLSSNLIKAKQFLLPDEKIYEKVKKL